MRRQGTTGVLPNGSAPGAHRGATSSISLPEPTPARFPLRPVLFIHGAYANSPERWTRYMAEDGFPPAHIHKIRYEPRQTWEIMQAQIAAQMQTIFAAYPAGTRFDIVSQSLGQPLALHTIINYGFDAHIAKLIGVVGIAHGLDKWFCKHGICGRGEEKFVPYNNAFIRQFMAANDVRIRAIDHCGIASPNDRWLGPSYRSSFMPGGRNVEVPPMGHLNSLVIRESYDAMKSVCYAGEIWPPRV